MPFDEEEDDIELPRNSGLKKVSTSKSIFDGKEKKPSKEDLLSKINKIEEKSDSYKSRAASLASQFNKLMSDTTLSVNKSVFDKEFEKDLLINMISLATEINNDPNEKEGMGSLSWITLLLKTCFNQRDRINKLEFNLYTLEKKLNGEIKKNNDALDEKKNRE
jgi:hypothetical protein